MDKLAVCRICLANDIPMRFIVHKCLQEMYEVLTKIPFVTEDSRPMLVCYICCARLHNSYKLTKSCLRSEELFQRMMSTNVSSSVSLTITDKFPSSRRFGITQAVDISYSPETCVEGQSSELHSIDVEVKQETIDDFTNETSEEMDIKQEEMEIKQEEYIQSCYTNNAMSSETPTFHCEIKTINESETDVTNCIKTESCDDDEDSDIIKWSDTEHESITIQVPTLDVPLHQMSNTSQMCHGFIDERKKSSVAQSENIQVISRKYKKCYRGDYNEETAHTKATIGEVKQYTAPNDVTTLYIESTPSTSASAHSVAFEKKKEFKKKSSSVKTKRKPSMRSYQCDICKKVLKEKTHLVDHIRIHTGEKPFKCDICKKCFNLKSSLNVHTRIHTGEAPFKCNFCNERFRQKVHLSAHIRKHTGEKPFQCDVCNKFLSHKNALIRHRLIHTRTKKSNEKSDCGEKGSMNDACTLTDEKPFECNICNKSFRGEKVFMDHYRMHTGEKPFKCDVCKKGFSQKILLARHLRIHSGVKPFECDICKRPFTLKHNLLRHFSTHTGEKPYECDVCKRCFSFKPNLIRHQQAEKILKCNFCDKIFCKKFDLYAHIGTHNLIRQ